MLHPPDLVGPRRRQTTGTHGLKMSTLPGKNLHPNFQQAAINENGQQDTLHPETCQMLRSRPRGR
jgi:hypothetical protein